MQSLRERVGRGGVDPSLGGKQVSGTEDSKWQQLNQAPTPDAERRVFITGGAGGYSAGLPSGGQAGPGVREGQDGPGVPSAQKAQAQGAVGASGRGRRGVRHNAAPAELTMHTRRLRPYRETHWRRRVAWRMSYSRHGVVANFMQSTRFVFNCRRRGGVCGVASSGHHHRRHLRPRSGQSSSRAQGRKADWRVTRWNDRASEQDRTAHRASVARVPCSRYKAF